MDENEYRENEYHLTWYDKLCQLSSFYLLIMNITIIKSMIRIITHYSLELLIYYLLEYIS